MAKPTGRLEAGAIVGEFKVEELFPEGRGGMARVVRAVPRGRGGPAREVALKICKTSRVSASHEFFRAALKRETTILEGFKGFPGIVQILPIASLKGREEYLQRAIELEDHPWFFAMECLKGGKLETHLKSVGPLPVAEAASLGAMISRTLEQIHRKGVVHNDVKPDNILFREPVREGRPYTPVIIDFGIAAKQKDPETAGSIHYMSPERLEKARGDTPPEVRPDPYKADVWAVGVLLYRMLVGKEPFTGLTERSITSAILRLTPTQVRQSRRDIPEELDAFIIEACMAKNPRIRPHMADVSCTLEGFGLGVPASSVGPKGLRLPWQK